MEMRQESLRAAINSKYVSSYTAATFLTAELYVGSTTLGLIKKCGLSQSSISLSLENTSCVAPIALTGAHRSAALLPPAHPTVVHKDAVGIAPVVSTSVST
jgi:hypothetical protein